MKTIITTVGTSIFKNAIKSNLHIKDYYGDIENLHYSEWNSQEVRREDIKKTILDSDFLHNTNSSAEIQTIYKIIEDFKKLENKDYKIILLTTDTILSNLAAEIIQIHLEKEEFPKLEIRKIDNLLVSFEHVTSEEKKTEKAKINSGFNNLIKILDEIIKKEKAENCILNISGGYKALIPYTTIIGQLYKVPLMYMYEDSDTLVVIDPMPINFDMGIAELYMPYLEDRYLNNPDTIPLVAKKKLESWKLIHKNEEGIIKKDIIGELLFAFFDRNASLSKKSLGIFMEYKLYEYFINKQYQSLDGKKFPIIKKGEKIKSKEHPNAEEIDILLRENSDTSNSKTVFIEIKSLSESFKKDKIINRMKERASIAKEKNWDLQEYALAVYFPIFENIHDKVNLYKEYRREAEKIGIQFRVFYYNSVPVSNEQVHYQKFLQNPLEELHELTLFDEVMDSLKPITDKAVEIIIRSGNPQKVYLFGSGARRQMQEDSDLDFCIIEDSNGASKTDTKKYYIALSDFKYSKDIIVRSPAEFEENKLQKNTVEYEIFHEGIVLYEK